MLIHGFTNQLSEEKKNVPLPMDLLGQAIGVDRQFPVPFEGVSKYRYAISHPIKMPIGQVYAIGFCPWRPTFRF